MSECVSAPRANVCDCGRPIVGLCEACPRCSRLDGGTGRLERLIVSVLRTHDWLTIDEIMASCGSSYRSVFRALKRLADAGRLRRFYEEHHSPSRNPMGAGLAMKYRYRLIF